MYGNNRYVAFCIACVVAWLAVGVGPAAYKYWSEGRRLERIFFAVKPPVRPAVQIEKDIFGLQDSWKKDRSILNYFQVQRKAQDLDQELQKYWSDGQTRGDGWNFPRLAMIIQSVRTGLSRDFNDLVQDSMRGDRESTVRQIDKARKAAGMENLPRAKNASVVLLWPAIWTGWIFAGLFLLARADGKGMSPLLELASPWFWMALLVYPVGVFKYPTETAVYRQARRVLRFAVFALSACLSGGMGTAMAQTVKKTEKKSAAPFALIADFRESQLTTGPEPVSETTAKATLFTPRGWMAESTNVFRNRFWATTDNVGHDVLNSQGIRLTPSIGMNRNSAGATALLANIKASWSRGRFNTAFPSATFEHRLDNGANALSYANQTWMTFGKWRAGAETCAKKVFGKTTTWYAGALGGHNIGKVGLAELMLSHDQNNDWRLRGRITYRFGW